MTDGARKPLLAAENVGRVFRRHGVERVALKDVSFSLEPVSTLAVVGESGAGKTTLSRLIAGLDRPTTGSIAIEGKPPRVRGGRPSPVQMIFQHPGEALNPFHSVGRSVAEPVRSLRRRERLRRVSELLQAVGLDPGRMRQRPASFSGGQLQRVVIARALAARPRLLLCDEPTSALDVSVQAQIVNLLLDLQASLGFACVLVTHDLSIARVLADDVLVLRRGEVVEYSPAASFFECPRHEYSRKLLETTSQQALASWYARQGELALQDPEARAAVGGTSGSRS